MRRSAADTLGLLEYEKRVTKDGVIVLVKGSGDKEKSQTLEVDTDLEKARKGASKLRNFDREVNSLLKLVREKRKAYVMTGHGEMNDPDSVPPEIATCRSAIVRALRRACR